LAAHSINYKALFAPEGLAESATEAGGGMVSPRDFSTSLARGLQVITAFDSDHDMMTLSDVARRTGMTRAAARRFLLTLGQLGYVVNEGRLFRLTPRTLNLGFSYLSSTHIWERAQPFMEQLVGQVQESC
jgi:IclR family pca regulon transcriptional regulator